MRVRNQTNRTSGSRSESVYDVANGTLVSSGSSSTLSDVYDTSFMEDVKTPFFKKRQANGEVIINPMSSCRSSVEGDAGSGNYSLIQETRANSSSPWLFSEGRRVEMTGRTTQHRIEHNSVADLLIAGYSTYVRDQFNLGELDSLESNLIARAHSNASRPEALSVVTLAELDKTFELFSQGAQLTSKLVSKLDHFPLKTVREFAGFTYKEIRAIAESRNRPYTVLKSGKKIFSSLPSGKRVTAGLVSLASTWLAYRYGIMATYYDCVSWFDASKAVGSSRRGKFTSTEASTYDSGVSSNTATGDWSTDTSTERRIRHSKSTAGVLITAEPAMGTADAFGAFNILSTAWELVPYSFVIDWFIDVGNRLAAFEGMILRPVLGSWVVHRSDLNWIKTFRPQSRVNQDGDNHRKIGVDLENTYAVVQENTVLTVRKANPAVSPIPGFNVRLNTKRVIDGVSLLLQSSERMKRIIRY